MILAVYIRNNPSKKWHLVSTNYSGELAQRDLEDAIDKAKKAGNELVEGSIQAFDSTFFVPEYLKEIKETPPFYN